MRKILKIVGAIALTLVLAIASIVVYDFLFNQLPADTPRVVTTADYEFSAPDGWLTVCAREAPGCLAVLPCSPSMRGWSSRQYWIEAQSVESAGVVDAASFVERAREEAARLAIANGGRADELLHADDAPTEYDGTEAYTFADASGRHFTQSLFIRLPSGPIQRFTCYAEVTADAPQTSADTCLGVLQQLRFPRAAALAAEREAEAAAAREAEAAAALEAERLAAAARDAAAERERLARAEIAELTRRPFENRPLNERNVDPGSLRSRAAVPGAQARFNRALKDAIPRVRAIVQASKHGTSPFFVMESDPSGWRTIESTVAQLLSLTTDEDDLALAERVYASTVATAVCHARQSISGLGGSVAPDCVGDGLKMLDRLGGYAATLTD